MDRLTWLKEMRRVCEEEYDIRWAPLYGEKWGVYSNATHRQFLHEFLTLLPEKARSSMPPVGLAGMCHSSWYGKLRVQQA